MARYIFVDAADAGGFTVRILSGLRGDTTRRFADRADARRYAEGKLGRHGCILDTTNMTPEQLAAYRACEVRFVNLAAGSDQQEDEQD